MAIPNQTPYNIFTANGISTVFPYEFYLLNAFDLTVSINGAELTSGFTISGIGNVDGGEVTFLTPPANGSVILLERVVPAHRLTEYQDNGDLLAETVNKDFDRLWMAIQQAFLYLGLALTRPLLGGPFNAKGYRIENIGDPVNPQDAVTKKWFAEQNTASLARTLRVPESSVNQLPSIAVRRNKVLAFDSIGNPYPIVPESGSASDVLIELAKPDSTVLVGGVPASELNRTVGSKYSRANYFSIGGVLNKGNQAWLRSNGFWYAYRGDIPADGIVIDPGFIPDSNWINVGLATMPNGKHSLLDFGCIDDNGVTDNRLLIQLAIEYMEFCGSTLYTNSSSDGRYFGVNSLHPYYVEGYALVITNPRNVKIIGGRNRNSSIKYTGSVSGMAMLAIVAPTSDWGMTITSLGISAGNKLNHCLYGVNVWYAQNNIEGGCYEDAALDGIHVSMYMSRFARVFANNNGRDGFSFGGPLTDGGYSSGTCTSLSLDNCWARGSGHYGFFCANELWYSEWSSLGCDGVPGLRTPVAYAFTNAKGVTLNGIGAEQCIKLMIVGSFRGFNVNGIQMSNVGPASGSVDYCIELVSGFSATFSGFAPEGQFDSKFTYTLFVSNATGNEFVTILDKSIKSEKVGHMKANPTGFYNFPDIVGYAVSRSQDRGFPRAGNTLSASSGTTVTPQSTGVSGTIIQREAVIRIDGPGNVSIFSTPGSTNFTAVVDVTCVIKSGSDATPQAVARQWVSTKVDGTLKLHGSLGTPQVGWSFDNPAGGGLIGVVDNTPGIIREFIIRVRFVSTDNSGINFAI
ncbi:phage tail fiber protein [Serratia fonticola]|uniref:phage tail fiber domain-containing protein n=1 Tax=Serratia fonticola TaxID=47917 RepID=UPI003AB0EC54